MKFDKITKLGICWTIALLITIVLFPDVLENIYAYFIITLFYLILVISYFSGKTEEISIDHKSKQKK